MRSILQFCLLLLLLFGAGAPAWGKVTADPPATARRAAEDSAFRLGDGAPPARPAAGEAAMWGLEVAGAGNGRPDSTPTTAGLVVVPVRGAAFMVCPGSPPPFNPGATTNLAWMMVGMNLYAYCEGDPVNKYDYLGMDAQHLFEAWQNGQMSFMTFVAEGGLTIPLQISMPMMPPSAPNDMIRQVGEMKAEADREVAIAVADTNDAYKQGVTEHTTAFFWGRSFDLVVGHLTGLNDIEESYKGERIELIGDGQLATRQLSGLERTQKGVIGGVQFAGILLGGRAAFAESKVVTPKIFRPAETTPVLKMPSPGVTVRKSGNYWIKEVDPNGNRLSKWFGERSLKYQSQGLTKLGDMAPAHIFKNGKLITRDAGLYTPGNFWRTWLKGSWRLGTPMNDIRPRNIGSNGLIFDPALDPMVRPLYWTAFGGVVGAGGYGVYKLFDEE